VTYPGRPAPTGEPDWLTLGQAAKFLGVAQSTIRKWSDQGRVPAFYTPGGHRRYRRGDLEAFLERSGPGGRSPGPLVLVVDDDERLREFMRVNLEMEGYTVREASSADEALAALEERLGRAIHALVLRLVEILGPEQVRDLEDGVAVDQQRAEDALLRGEVVGRGPLGCVLDAHRGHLAS